MKNGRGTLVDVAVGFGARGARSLDEPFELAPGDLFLEPLEDDERDAIFRACHIARFTHGGMPHAYALVLLRAIPGHWARDTIIWKALNYSRLAWRNVMALEFTAQARLGTDGTIQEVIPARISSPSLARAYLPAGMVSVYPTTADAKLLGDLLSAPVSEASRVATAMWRFSHAAFMDWSNFRLNLLLGAIETLVNTQRSRATEQFLTRVAGLSQLCLGTRRYGRLWARRIYKIRNSLAHGRRLSHHRRGYRDPDRFEQDYSALAAEVEMFVRAVLVAAYTRRDVLALLQSPRKIAARWPLPVPAKRGKNLSVTIGPRSRRSP